VDLLIALVQKIKTRAEHPVEEELVADLRRVRDKQQILFRLAEAALAHPDETVRVALSPVVGEATPRDVVREVDADETYFRARVHASPGTIKRKPSAEATHPRSGRHNLQFLFHCYPDPIYGFQAGPRRFP
jgi:hypothetical protein